MNRLVLGTLAAIASLAGCGGSSDAVVTMHWSFVHLADGAARSCPTGFGTASIVSQSTDPVTHLGVGTTIVDKFDCAAGRGTITLPDDTYIVWVQIENSDGSSVYAKSAESYVDTLDGDQSIDVQILDDGGYFFLTWDLVRESTGAALSCRDAGVTANGAVDVLTKLVTSSSVTTDKFTCEDHFGTTAPLLSGDYDVTVEASNNGILGIADPIAAKIKAPNGLTYLGDIVIPIN
jgi:hypothetical protein